MNNRRLSLVAVAAALGLCGALIACHHVPPPPRRVQQGQTQALLREDQTLGVGDVFDVRVYGEPDMTAKYRVGADGTIDFPLVGRIQVAGLLPSQVVTTISDRLKAGIMKSPHVSVYVHEQASKKIHVLGQVSKPGTFPFTPGMSLVEAITQAGGFTQLAAKNGTSVTRLDNGKKLTFNVAAGDISDGVAANFYLRPGDIISVPERFF